MNKLTAAYLAGLIDGEGYLGIQRHRKKRCVNGIEFIGVFKIAMVDKKLIEWLKISFGGNLYERKKEVGENAYEWTLRHEKNIKPVIDKVYPYLRVKKKQAEILKKFFSTFKKENYISRYLTDNTRNYREELCWQIRALNLNKGKKYVQPERLNSGPLRGSDSPNFTGIETVR